MRRRFLLALWSVAAFSACGGDRSPDDGELGSTTSTAATTAQGETDTNSATASLRLGDPCFYDHVCESERCWPIVPDEDEVPGLCSECATDEDCEHGGCEMPLTSLSGFEQRPWAACNDGGLGARCMDDDACAGDLSCVLLVDTDVVGWPIATCSHCAVDADCGDELCSPIYDVSAGGYKTCVAAGSVPIGQGCDALGSGSEACASGICRGVLWLEGHWPLALCSDTTCEQAEECEEGLSCLSGSANVEDGLQPVRCG
jgi:hypothetical protein